MGIVEDFSALPTPVKVGIGGAAAGGLLVAMLNRRPAAPAQVAQAAQGGPITLPAGAADSNAGELQQNTLALVQGLIDKSQAATAETIAGLQAAEADQMQAIIKNQHDTLQSSQDALTAQQQAQTNALTAMFNSLKTLVDTKLTPPVVNNPAPGNAPGGGSPNPPAPGSGGGTNPGMSLFLRDVKSWVGDRSAIIQWVAGSDYRLGTDYRNGDWQGGSAQAAGTKDYNVGLVLPFAYDPTKDTHRYDYSTHQNAESTYARWSRMTLDVLTNHPELSQYQAGMIAASRIKRDFSATGTPLYSAGIDFSQVPDNYGKGTYWQ